MGGGGGASIYFSIWNLTRWHRSIGSHPIYKCMSLSSVVSCFKRGLLTKNHHAHLLIVLLQRIESVFRRDQSKASWSGCVVTGPARGTERFLVHHDLSQQLLVRQSFIPDLSLGHHGDIVVVARVPIRQRFLSWPVIFGMQDRNFKAACATAFLDTNKTPWWSDRRPVRPGRDQCSDQPA